MPDVNDASNPPSVGLVLRDPLPWQEVVEVAATAEDAGYDAFFVPESSGRGAFATLAALAQKTETLRLGTGVVPVSGRTPLTTAMEAATLSDLSDGRYVLGIGSGAPGSGVLDTTRRYVDAVDRLLRGEEAEVDGRRARLEMVPPQPPPVWIAALGDRMIQLGGTVADGVILNWCPPERVEQATALVRDARSRRERPGAVTVAVYVRACLGVSEAVALEALRPMVARYAAMPHYRRQMEQMGLGPDAGLAARAFDSGRMHDVPDDLIHALCVTGGRDAARARLAAYRDAGADLVLWYPVAGRDPLSSIISTIFAAAPSPNVER